MKMCDLFLSRTYDRNIFHFDKYLVSYAGVSGT